MNQQTIMSLINALTIGSLLFSIIYTAGIVWRVEMKLDISYKFFLAAVISIFLAEILDLFYSLGNSLFLSFASKALHMLFAIFFLIGVMYMRKIVMILDGEIEKE